jgi:hypothetical protein
MTLTMIIFRDFQKSPHILKQAAAGPKYPGTPTPPTRDGVLEVFETLCYESSGRAAACRGQNSIRSRLFYF